MSDLIHLSERLADRSRPNRPGRTSFFFELGCPLAYLAAERIERALGHVEWNPSARLEPLGADRLHRRGDLIGRMLVAEREAERLQLPLIVPDGFDEAPPLRAWRAAAYATERGAGAAFALAASRLVFCGGFDLDAEETIAEAAAAAGLFADDCLAAARESRRDLPLFATARGLMARGVESGPAIRVATRWFHGIDPVGEAASFVAVRAVYGALHG